MLSSDYPVERHCQNTHSHFRSFRHLGQTEIWMVRNLQWCNASGNEMVDILNEIHVHTERPSLNFVEFLRHPTHVVARQPPGATYLRQFFSRHMVIRKKFVKAG